MIGGGEIINWIKQVVVGKKTELKAVTVPPPAESEAERLARILSAQLKTRVESSRPQPGGGAFGGVSGESVASVPGEAPIVTIAGKGGLPLKDFTKKI